MAQKNPAFIDAPRAFFNNNKFSPVPGIGQIFRQARAGVLDDGKKYISHLAASKAQKALKTCVDGVLLPNKNIVGSVINGKHSLIGKNDFSVSYHSRTTSYAIGLGDTSSRIYNTYFETGIPSTSRLRNPLETKIKCVKCIRDSERDYLSSSSRKSLTTVFGFNQRSYDFLRSDTFLKIGDMRFLYGDRYPKIDKGLSYDVYGDFLQEKLKLCIKSETQHYSLQFKIYVVKVINNDCSIDDVVRNSFYKGLEIDSGSFTRAIPTDYQFSDPVNYGEFRSNVLTDLKCTLNSSNYFRRNCEVVKTFSRVLAPNDIWNFEYKLNYGAGVFLNDLFQDQSNDLTVGYNFIIDCQGDPRASMTRLSDGANFDGSSPGRYDYRFFHEISFLREQYGINSDQSEKPTITQFPNKSDSFESDRLGKFFNSSVDNRSDKINVDFSDVDVNVVSPGESTSSPYKLRYSESRLVAYQPSFSNPMDTSINLDNNENSYDSPDDSDNSTFSPETLGDDPDEEEYFDLDLDGSE